MNINRELVDVLLRFPLFGNVIAHLNYSYVDAHIAPSFTDGSTIYFQKDLFTDYDYDERVFIVAHEIFHVILRHLFRNKGRDPELLNYCEDAIINKLLDNAGLKRPKDCIYIENALDYSVDELYMKLLPNLDNIKKVMILFPHFTDVAGDYEEGTAPKFSELKIPTTCWRVNPHFFNTIAGADEFLADTLPFSSYQIVKDTKTLDDGTKIITYFAPSEDGVFGKDGTLTGKGSYLFLIQTPDEPLYVGIFEGSYDGEP